MCTIVFPLFFVVRPKTFEIPKRSRKIKTNTVYKYCQKFNMRKESTGPFIILSFIRSSWNNFGISESYDFQKCYVVPNFEFLETFSFARVKQKFYLNLAKYYDHICASVGNRKIFHEWFKVRSVDLEILGRGYNVTHLSDFGGFKSSSG